ncbi:MAG: DUF6273 domain-containing protein [Clostridiales bacterium]|nr:DUF6273 domain-containing protein [Clostridiales bacterium]
MSEPIKKPLKAPEGFSPKKPEIANMMDELYTEKVIDTVVIEGVEFQIIEKGRTYYAGAYGVEPDIEELIASNDPVIYENDGDILNKGQDVGAIINSIQNVITPDYNICLNIDYTTHQRPCARLVGKETTSLEQPDGVHIIEAEPTLLIKVKYTHAAWVLTKKIIGIANQYRVTELFDLIKHYFCEGEQAEYEYNGDNGTGNADSEFFYNTVGRGVAVPVKKRVGGTSTKAKYSTGNIVIVDDFKCPATLTDQEIKDMQEPPKEFEKITFAGYDWLVLEKQGDKALLLSEILVENRQFHHSKTEATWATCDLRDYLNNEFYLNAFNDEQRAKIIKTTLPPYINPWYGLNNNKARIVQLKEKTNYNADAAKITDDFVFILSVEEILKYFGDNGDLEKRVGYTWQGENAEADFALRDGFGQFIFDQYSDSRIAKDAEGNANAYWTRTPGYQYLYNFGVYDNGNFWPATGGGVHQTLGVRPAIWVKL